MVTYVGKELYAIYLSDGEYDSYRHCVIAIVNSAQEAREIVAELNLIHENEVFTILKEGSEVYNDIKAEYGLFHDTTFGWETIPVMSFKEG